MSLPPSPQVLLMVDVNSASGGSISSANPPMNTYTLDIPEGGNALQVAHDFAAAQKYPVDTSAYIIDLSFPMLTIRKFTLQANWVED